jgi:hypothetical protein
MCAGSTEPHLFAQSDLARRREKGRLEIECAISFEGVSVLMLLDGLDLTRMPSWAVSAEPPPAEPDRSSTSAPSRTIKIFLASSSELRQDRDEFELYFRQLNDDLGERGIYLKITRWENFLDAMSATRLQDEYNQAVRDSDVVVCLIATQAGGYTREEFRVALKAFRETGRPRIFTYFKQVQTSGDDREGLQSLWEFQDEVREAGHFPTSYKSAEHLTRDFGDQLRRLLS